MGVINQGILGGFSGKVGPVVGAKWKSIDYMRSYVIPSNPNTPAQQTQRTRFAAMVALARQLLTSVIQPFWSPFYSTMSGFNAFIKENIELLDSSNLLTVSAVMSKGTLAPTSQVTTSYNPATGVASVTWNTDLTGNASATDSVIIIAYDKANNKLYFKSSNELRGDASDTIELRSGLTASNVYCWVFFYRGTGSELIVSDSLGDAG